MASPTFKFNDRRNFNPSKSSERYRVITNMQTPQFAKKKVDVFTEVLDNDLKPLSQFQLERKKREKTNNVKLSAD